MRRRIAVGTGLGISLLGITTAHAGTFAQAASSGMASAFLFAFTAGLLTALTPCVYPMIPITISIFGGKGVPRGRALLLASLYVAGIAVMFGTLGTIFALVGKAFGSFLANPWVIVPLALFFALMAVSMFGAFELALPSSVQERLNRVGGRNAGGAFLMGLVGGLIAAPCTGPPLAGILAFVATTRNAVTGFFLLATYAVGIGVPFWAIAGFSMRLPKSGAWMETVKSVFGIALLVAALYYLKNVVPSLAHFTGRTGTFLAIATALVVVGGGIGAVHLTFHDGWKLALRKGAGVALAVTGLFAISNYVLTPKVELGMAAGRAGSDTARARQRSPDGRRLHGRLVPAVQGDGRAGVLAPGRRHRAVGVHFVAGRSHARGRGPGAGDGQIEVRGQHAAGGPGGFPRRSHRSALRHNRRRADLPQGPRPALIALRTPLRRRER